MSETTNRAEIDFGDGQGTRTAALVRFQNPVNGWGGGTTRRAYVPIDANGNFIPDANGKTVCQLINGGRVKKPTSIFRLETIPNWGFRGKNR